MLGTAEYAARAIIPRPEQRSLPRIGSNAIRQIVGL